MKLFRVVEFSRKVKSKQHFLICHYLINITLVKNKMTENSFPRINIRTIDLSHGDTFFYLSFLRAMLLNSNVDHYFHN